MSLADEIKIEHRVADVFDLAIAGLVVNCGITHNEAAQMLLTQCARQLTPGAVSQALRDQIGCHVAPNSKGKMKMSDNINDPRLAELFKLSVAMAIDATQLTPQQVCEAYFHLAASGLVDPIVDTILAHKKMSPPHRAPENLYAFDCLAPHKIPAVANPAEESDMPLGVHFR